MKDFTQGQLALQNNGRYAIYKELTSGDAVEVFVDGDWKKTSVESANGKYYLTNGHPIDFAIVRITN